MVVWLTNSSTTTRFCEARTTEDAATSAVTTALTSMAVGRTTFSVVVA